MALAEQQSSETDPPRVLAVELPTEPQSGGLIVEATPARRPSTRRLGYAAPV